MAQAPEIVHAKISPEVMKRYIKAGYAIVGPHMHSGVEICRWTKHALKGEGYCYKRWYGVASHRCVQMTPTLNYCDFSCVFCWRMFNPDRFKASLQWDDPLTVLRESIIAQRKLLAGYKGHPSVTVERFLEAMHPVHFAISLDGEPTLYPYITGLIAEIKKRGWTAFIVTNGTVTQRLREMLDKGTIPTNLYISVYATNAEDYVRITNSFIPEPFEKVKKSLALMREFEKKGGRTVFRVTTVKNINMKDPEGYARLVEMASPMFVEFKGYSWAGESTKRLTKAHMPTLEELLDFGREVGRITGYEIKEVDSRSRVIMLVRDKETWERNLELIKMQKERIAKYDETWKPKYKNFTWRTQLNIDRFDLP